MRVMRRRQKNRLKLTLYCLRIAVCRIRTLSALVIFATVAQTLNAQRPPTVDPTYGLPNAYAPSSASDPQTDADWVWTRETKDDQTVWFRKSFQVSAIPKAAWLYMTVDNFFTAYLNGHQLGKTIPVPHNDFVWARVHKFNVDHLLRKGENVIAVVAKNGAGPAGLLARLETDGSPVLFSDWTWMQMETLPPKGWMLPGFKENGWTGALRIASAGDEPWGSRLKGWPVPVSAAAPYLRRIILKPVAYAILGDPSNIDVRGWRRTSGDIKAERPKAGKRWAIVVDFGKEVTGSVLLRLAHGAPLLHVRVGTGESSSEAIARPWTTNDLDLKGSVPMGTIDTALRYAVLALPANARRVGLNVRFSYLYYPVAYRGSFACSDPILTKLWYTGAYTAHCCMQQDIWDAPKRDRMRWMGDLHVSGEVIDDVFLDRFLMERTLSLLRKEPQGGRPLGAEPEGHVNGIPGYSCAWICGLADFYRHTGDKKYVESQHAALLSMLEYFDGEFNGDNLFINARGKWPFVHWAPEFNSDTPQARAATQMFFIKALADASFMLRALKDKEQADNCDRWRRNLIQSANSHFYLHGEYGDRRQENAMAVYSGAAPPSEWHSIWEQVLNPESPSWSYPATPYYNSYVITAMSEMGHTSEALDFVRKYWGGMLAEGATTFWEAYDPSWPKQNFHKFLQADNAATSLASATAGRLGPRAS